MVRQVESTIATNDSLREFNKVQKLFAGVIVIATLGALVISIMSYCLQRRAQEQRLQEKDLQNIQKLLKDRKVSDSLFRLNVQEILGEK